MEVFLFNFTSILRQAAAETFTGLREVWRVLPTQNPTLRPATLHLLNHWHDTPPMNLTRAAPHETSHTSLTREVCALHSQPCYGFSHSSSRCEQQW